MRRPNQQNDSWRVLVLALLATNAAAQPASSLDPNRLTDLRNIGVSIALAQTCQIPSKQVALVAQRVMLNAGRNLTDQQAIEATQALNAGIAAGQRQAFPAGTPPCSQITLDFMLLAAKSGVAIGDWQAAGQTK